MDRTVKAVVNVFAFNAQARCLRHRVDPQRSFNITENQNWTWASTFHDTVLSAKFNNILVKTHLRAPCVCREQIRGYVLTSDLLYFLIYRSVNKNVTVISHAVSSLLSAFWKCSQIQSLSPWIIFFLCSSVREPAPARSWSHVASLYWLFTQTVIYY